MINIENVSYKYKNGKNVLKNISFSIKNGEIVTIVGKNGSGKSTIGKLISGILKLKEGCISIDGMDISKRKNRELISSKIGIVFQNPDSQIIFSNIKEEFSYITQDENIIDDALKYIWNKWCELKDNKDFAGLSALRGYENKKVIGIGEIGLDYHYTKENIDIQKNCFISQIEIAKMLDLPMVIHDRDAHFDTLEILKKHNAKKVLLHCFSGSVEFMKECVKLGYKIAIGGVVTFKNAKVIKEVAKEIDLADLMLETDCPYLTPHPFRGMENSPKYIGFVAKEIASLKNLPYDSIVDITTKNAKEFFNID